ncbi:helicase associated domain-containing protein [Streptomyces sp. NPDC127574]|uniref:helicase associated domain-containing protein n=1 Tax=Streptomyces sp. NPDC127574 TaxID=3345401 RepID=UPI00362D3718
MTKVLGALRAHDTETIEALADPRVRNSRPEAEQGDVEGEFEGEDGGQEQGEDVARVSGAAAGVLRFSEERDPFALTQFVRLRIIDPEGAYWRRGIEAATRWLRETGSSELRVPYLFTAPEEWGAVGGYPLGRWIADVRRYYAAGTLEAARVTELETLGMVWSAWDTAWADGLAVAKDYAAVHGHLVPPTNAVWGGDGMTLGVAEKPARRRPQDTRERRTARRRGHRVGRRARRGAGLCGRARAPRSADERGVGRGRHGHRGVAEEPACSRSQDA